MSPFCRHQPLAAEDITGLGGGIAYAWDPALCDTITEYVKEKVLGQNLAGCDDIKNSFKRSMLQWTMNHRYITAYDVTGQCEVLQGGKWNVTAECPLVELWVTSAKGVDAALVDPATSVLTGGKIVAATVLTATAGTDLVTAGARAAGHAFRHTNGVVSNIDVIENTKATIHFGANDEVCWYLDTDFCASFAYELRNHGADSAETIFLAMTFLLWCFAIATMAYRLRDLAQMFCCKGRLTKKMGLYDESGIRVRNPTFADDVSIEIAEWNSFVFTIQVIGILIPPIFFYEIIHPCFTCYNFEAASAQQIGHVLGLGHPNNVQNELVGAEGLTTATPGQNMFHALLAAGTYMSGVAGGLTPPYAFTYAEYVSDPATGTCANPWKNVAVGLPANASTDGYSCKGTDDKNIEGCTLVRRSVMNPLSNANPVTCLGQDDLEGLHTLYPDCGSLSFVEPICLVYSHNLGIQRVGYYIGGFMLFILMATKSMQSYVMYFREKQLTKDLARLAKKEMSNAKTRWRLAYAYAKEIARKERIAAARAELNLPEQKTKEQQLADLHAAQAKGGKMAEKITRVAAQTGAELSVGRGGAIPAVKPPASLNRL